MSDDARIDEPVGPPPEEPKPGWWQARSGLQKFLIVLGAGLVF